MEFYQALILIIIANAAPLLGRYLLPFSGLDFPVDFHKTLYDGHPILGHSKTFRGLIVSLLASCITSWWLGLGIVTGMIVSALAMSGDMLSSFIKRRLGYPSGKMAPGLDQLAESLLPLYYLHLAYGLDLSLVAAGIFLFGIIDIVFSRFASVIDKMAHTDHSSL